MGRDGPYAWESVPNPAPRGNAAGMFLLTSDPAADRHGPCGHDNLQHWEASVSRLYRAQQRALQDRFDTRRIADKIEALAIHPEPGDMGNAGAEDA